MWQEQTSDLNGAMATSVRRLWQNPRVEKILLPYALQSTQAHLRMLGDCHLIDADVSEALSESVALLRDKVANGENILEKGDEDVLSAVQRHIDDTVGAHADAVRLFLNPREQLAIDLRLWMRDTVLSIAAGIAQLRTTILAIAEEQIEVMLPTYVHMKKSRSIALSDFWLTYELRFARDFKRLDEIRKKLETIPLTETVQLSSGKVIEKERVGQYLGFYTIVENNLDATTDRDYLLEFSAFASILCVHISQLAADLITWSTQEFGFVRQTRPFQFHGHEVSHKKNQEILGMLRSRPSAVFGRMQESFAAMKGLSVNYSQDFEECVPSVIDTADHVNFLIELLIAYLPNLEFDMDALKDASNPVIISGESAIEFLVARQVDRKKAEKAVEELIQYCKERHKQPSDMTMNEWSQFSMAFDSGIYDAIANSEMEQASSHNSEYLHLDVRRKVMESIQSAHLLVEDDRNTLSAPDLHL
jgi:argininosuccinate lyase